MSSLVVKTTTIDEVNCHNNADALELVTVGGWQCVVRKGQYKAGDKIVYFPPDTVLPQEWIERFGITNYVYAGRIRCATLRGEPSFGLVVSPDQDWPLGIDVGEYYGATKYEPPVKTFAGDIERPHPLFVEYTNIENLRSHPDIFQDGEQVILGEKLDGGNVRIALIEGILMAGSHKLRRKEPEDYSTSTYWFPLTKEPVRNLLNDLSKEYKQVILFGEVFGSRIQKFDYGVKGVDFRAFDLFIDGKYVDYEQFSMLCDKYGVPTVPLSGIVPFSLETVKSMASGKAFSGSHIKEGVVCRPTKERTDPRIGRCILKYKSDAYLLEQKEDFTDI